MDGVDLLPLPGIPVAVRPLSVRNDSDNLQYQHAPSPKLRETLPGNMVSTVCTRGDCLYLGGDLLYLVGAFSTLGKNFLLSTDPV